MDKTQQVKRMTYVMTRLVDYMSKKLPDDVENKLRELAAQETNTLAKLLYETYFKNQDEALRLNRPSCQDTGLLQFFVRCGSEFPLILNLEGVLREAVKQATIEAPLRHNAVETFDEYNTGLNIGKDAPSVFWEIVSGDRCEIDAYMAGGGCTLPGHAMVLMPGDGYEGVVKYVLDVLTEYGINACPPLLVGVGVATSVETAALLSKKALMRPLGQHNPNERAAGLERLLEEGINRWGDDYGAVKLPTYTCAGQQIQMSSFKGYKYMAVNAYTKYPEWANKLAQWFTNEDNQKLRFEMKNAGPANKAAAADDAVKKVPAIMAVMDQAQYGKLQRVGNSYWDAATEFGEKMAAGNPDNTDLQEIMDNFVAGITQSVAE